MSSAYIDISSVVTPNVAPGGVATVTTRVINTSPTVGLGLSNMFVQAVLPPGYSVTSWTATYNGGATGPALGTGSLNAIVTSLPASGYVDFTYTFTVPAGSAFTTQRVRFLATVAEPQVIIGSGVSDVFFSIVKPRLAVTVTKTGSATMLRGQKYQYVISVANTSAEAIDDAYLTDFLPKGIYFNGWGTATGAGTFNAFPCLPSGLVSIPAGGTITIPLNVVVSVNACLGAVSNDLTFTFPECQLGPNGETCLYAKADSQIVNITAVTSLQITGCVQSLCPGAAATVGYATVDLVTPGCRGYNPVTGATLVVQTQRFDLTADCFTSCLLPVNNHIGSCGDAAVPTFYNVKLFSAPTTGVTTLLANVNVKLDSSMTGIIDINSLLTDDICERCN